MKFYIGTYARYGGRGIAQAEAAGDRLMLTDWESTQDDPSYLLFDRESGRLYAACESPTCYAACYDAAHALRLLSAQETGGRDTCHITLSPDRRFAYTANYSSGSLSVFPVTEEGLGARIQLIQNTGHGVNPDRQEAPHSHCVRFAPDGRYLCLCDLGTDDVIVYRQDAQTGLLTETPRLHLTDGWGVRHIAFADAHTAFAVHEMGNAVTRLHYENGTLSAEKAWKVLDEAWTDRSFCAAIRLQDGLIYVTNRGKDTISVFDYDGTPIREFSTGGHWPRDMIFAGENRILCANQESGDVTLLDAQTGTLLDRLTIPGAAGLETAE